MKKNMIKIFIVFIAIFTVVMAIFVGKIYSYDLEFANGEKVVLLNEIKELTKIADTQNDKEAYEQLDSSIQELQKKLLVDSDGSNQRNMKKYAFFIYGIGIAFLAVISLYVYLVVIKPFEKLNDFANEIANGNFDTPLYYERKNLFGPFTWAFDNMRKEVKKARACEKESIENNKTVIATISHDIKTPIASIRAYAEGLEANMDSNVERRKRYLKVIMNKCDEVSNLTNDLFLHSLSDLDKLRMYLEPCTAKSIIDKILGGIIEESPNAQIIGEVPDVTINIDVGRLEQVFENIISNAIKYGQGSKIELLFEAKNNELRCHIRDYGEGIPSEDMPFVLQKFYRGKNVEDKAGAGLGLYIVKYIMEQMDGTITLINHPNGLEVLLTIPII